MRARLWYRQGRSFKGEIMGTAERIEELRRQIDEKDRTLLNAFLERMEVAGGIAEAKKDGGRPVLDPAREQAKLERILAETPEDMQDYVKRLYDVIFELSRAYQQRLIDGQK